MFLVCVAKMRYDFRMPTKLNCTHCGKRFTRAPLHFGNVNFCSKKCAYIHRRKEEVTSRRMFHDSKHPLSDKTGLVAEHRDVLWQKIGRGKHKCHWCKGSIKWMPGSRT